MKAEYAIRNLDILSGRLPKRANALVLECPSEHKGESMDNGATAAGKKLLFLILKIELNH